MTVPTIDNGEFVLPRGPGWGIDVNEKAVRARPPKTLKDDRPTVMAGLDLTIHVRGGRVAGPSPAMTGSNKGD